MPIDAVCLHCQATYRLADKLQGKQVRCKNCNRPFTVSANPAPELVKEVPATSNVWPSARPSSPASAPPRKPLGRRPTHGADATPAKPGGALVLVVCLAIGGLLLLGGAAILLIVIAANQPSASVAGNGDPEASQLERSLGDLRHRQVGEHWEALNWLNKNFRPDHPKRAEVARELMRVYETDKENHPVISQTLRLWATREQAPAFLALAQNPNDFNGRRRGFCCEMLGVLKDEKSIAYLVSQLKNGDQPSAVRGLTAMGPMAKKAVLPLIFSPAAFGSPGLEAHRLVKSYGATPDEILNQALLALSHPQMNVRAQVCVYLANPGTLVLEKRRAEVARALNPLLEFQTDKDQAEQVWAATQRWATKENVPTLIKLVEGRSAYQYGAINLLGTLKDERAVEPLMKYLTSTPHSHQAKDALKALGPPAGKAVLTQFNSSNFGLQNFARDTIREWKVNQEEIVRQCILDLSAKEFQRRRSALGWLAQTQPILALSPELSKAVQPLLSNGDPKMRQEANRVLNKWGGKDPLKGLLQSLTHPNRTVRQKAIVDLGQLKDPRAVPKLANRLYVLEDSALAIAALKQIGGKDTEMHMRQLVAAQDRRTATEACAVLEAIGTMDSVAVLTKAMKDYGQAGPINAAFHLAAEAACKSIQEPSRIEVTAKVFLPGKADAFQPIWPDRAPGTRNVTALSGTRK